MLAYIYGRNPVLEWLRAGYPTEKLLISRELSGAALQEIEKLAAGLNLAVENVSRPELARAAGSDHHQGVAARITLPDYVEVDEILARAAQRNEPPLLAILDCVQDPHNLGAILRSADGAGVHGVIIPKDNAAPMTAAVFKASAGAAAHVAVARVTNLSRTMDELKERGIWFAGTDEEGEQLYTELDLKGPTGLVLGSEGKGLRRLVREECDFVARIPLRGKVSSLNVSVAAAVLFFEARRQRGF
ncbi:MAG TPA: 23S rRNA (guanosine(2251)-2'-O)-methyltransferase RlmB [bacterium]|nr:23S rRNA (guanosine(2251)-2'-O)-methyltransferase RlmB [bacterium]HPR89618.1 23S rRNA (guanosine(2251)-2'-O)-methyltransferase RlmB [bacterium]